MYTRILLASALSLTFAASAFAATNPPAPKPMFFVELMGGKCSVTPTAVAPAPTLTAPDKLLGAATGYATKTAANTELAKLVKAKTCPA